jgi:hypothetical protein
VNGENVPLLRALPVPAEHCDRRERRAEVAPPGRPLSRRELRIEPRRSEDHARDDDGKHSDAKQAMIDAVDTRTRHETIWLVHGGAPEHFVRL